MPGKEGTMRPAAEPVQEIEALRARLSRLSRASLLINESLDFDFYNHERPHQSLNYRTPAQEHFVLCSEPAVLA